MEPLMDSRGGKENDAAQGPSPGCRPSPAASPAASDGSGARKRPAMAGQPHASPPVDPVRKRHRPGNPLSASTSPANERETSAEAAARRQLAALSSPSGRPGGGSAQVQHGSSPTAQREAASAAAPPQPPPPPPAYWWLERPLQPLQRDGPGAEQDPFSLLSGHPLLALACEGQAALLAKVLENGGDVDAQDGRGLTALHLASRHARLACVKVLLEAGARQLPDRQGCTPRQLAEQAGHTDVLDMMQQHEEVQAELQRQAREQQQRPAERGGAAGEEGT